MGKPKVYLMGPFTDSAEFVAKDPNSDFRDRIKAKISGVTFLDPRDHSQFSMAAAVMDDMGAAEQADAGIVVMPKGFVGGDLMTAAEMGALLMKGGYLYSVDENKQAPWELLNGVSDYPFVRMGDLVAHLNRYSIGRKDPAMAVSRTVYPKGARGKLPVKSVYICGDVDDRRVEALPGKIEDLTITISEGNYASEFCELGQYDLVVARFAGDRIWNPDVGFVLGGVFAQRIPIILVDEHKDLKYPPVEAMARRQMSLRSLEKYLGTLRDNNISAEVRSMYPLLAKLGK